MLPPRRYHKSWAASVLALTLGVAAPSRLLRSNAGATTTHAAAQNKGKSKSMSLWARAPTTRSSGADDSWWSSQWVDSALLLASAVPARCTVARSSAWQAPVVGYLLVSEGFVRAAAVQDVARFN